MSVAPIVELTPGTGDWEWEDKHVAQAYNAPAAGGVYRPQIAVNEIIESGTVLIAVPGLTISGFASSPPREEKSHITG